MKMRLAVLNISILIALCLNSCKKEDNAVHLPEIKYESVTDIDGNVYQTVIIGTQTWMAENLRTTKYNDGTKIILINDSLEWQSCKSGAYSKYHNTVQPDSVKRLGFLYNWVAAKNINICPKGWHLPKESDWAILENYLKSNGYNYEGIKTGNTIAKALASKDGWKSINSSSIIMISPAAAGSDVTSNNSSGFNGFPAGCRFSGQFDLIGEYAFWWTDAPVDSSFAMFRYLDIFDSSLKIDTISKTDGLSIRCLKD